MTVPTILRGSRRRSSIKKVVLKKFVKFTGKQPANSLKMRLWHRCFPVNFTKFLRTPFLQNTSGRLLLDFVFFDEYFVLFLQYPQEKT